MSIWWIWFERILCRGECALNENAVNDFVEWKDKTNLTSKIQWLESNESTYKKFGPFWLELAKSYYESEEYDKCLDAIKKYEGISVKIFRKDYDYAEALPDGDCFCKGD